MRDLATWRPQPVVLTVDRRIKTRTLEREALRESGLTYVVFQPSWMNFQFHEQAWRVLKAWPAIHAEVNKLEEGHTIIAVEIKTGAISVSR